MRNTYKSRHGQDSIEKHFMLRFFFRAYLIVYYELNKMCNEI